MNGLLYAVGGAHPSSGAAVATVEAYDPKANSWVRTGPMLTSRGSLGVAVVDGILYAVGGYNAFGTLTTLEAYDPAQDR